MSVEPDERRPPFVKICGVTNTDDALFAAAMGADAVGMIFAPSTRQVDEDQAAAIVRPLPPEVLGVGVFRNEHRDRVVAVANKVGLRVVQLHGDEPPEDTRWIAERVPNVIRAFSASDPALDRHEEYGPVRLLIDSPVPGSGAVFDWAVLERAPKVRYILAGGLTPDNVGMALKATRAWGVDVATGVEARPGVKSPTKVQEFVRSARQTAADLAADAERVGPYDWAHDGGWA